MTIAAEAPRRKQARLAVRLTPAQDELIRDAAATTGQTITDFVTSAAVDRAKDALADRRIFRLADESWTVFTTLLDRPAKRIPELSEILAEPAPWDEH